MTSFCRFMGTPPLGWGKMSGILMEERANVNESDALRSAGGAWGHRSRVIRHPV